MENKKTVVWHRFSPLSIHTEGYSWDEGVNRLGIDMVEIDIRRTKDGIFVPYHNKYLGNKPVHSLTLNESQYILNSESSDLQSFEKMLQLMKGKLKIDVELKEKGHEIEIINLLLKYMDVDKFIISSFNLSSIKKIKYEFPNIRTGLILGKINFINLQLSMTFPKMNSYWQNSDIFFIHWTLANLRFLSKAKSKNKQIFVWTVNKKLIIQKFLKNNIIDGLITDTPELVLSLMNKNL